MTQAAKPFIKFAGGKTALLPEILPRLPQKISTYYEPFVGGGAVFFALAAEGRFNNAVLGDTNEELMWAYAALARDVDGVIRALKTHVHEEAYYYTVRAQDPSKLAQSERAARIIYLNKTCFNGLYRVNKKGQFNVPFGSYKNPNFCDEENLRACAKMIQRSTLSPISFEETVRSAKHGDTVYFDSPYVPVSGTSDFTAYTKGGFGPADQHRLRNVAKKLVAKGVYVLLSNADVPYVRELYEGFKIEAIQAPRRVNSKGNRRGNVGEVLISGDIK